MKNYSTCSWIMLLASTSWASSSSSLSVASEVTSAPFCASCNWIMRSFKFPSHTTHQEVIFTNEPWHEWNGNETRYTLMDAILVRRLSSIWSLAMWKGRSKTSCRLPRSQTIIDSPTGLGSKQKIIWIIIPFYHPREIVKGQCPVFHWQPKMALMTHWEHLWNLAYQPVKHVLHIMSETTDEWGMAF